MRTGMSARWGLAGLLLMSVPACGGEAVAGGQRDVDVQATGDAPGGSPTRLSDGPARSAAAAAMVQGTITLTSDVRLVDGGTVTVGRGSGVQLRADGGDTVRVTTGRVPDGAYSSVRLVFRDVDASVTGGLVIGGVSLTGSIEVEIAPGDSVVVERAVAIGAGDDDIRLLVDLNAATWLSAANPVTRRVPAAAFAAAVQVRKE
jgi:hypothetical protein